MAIKRKTLKSTDTGADSVVNVEIHKNQEKLVKSLNFANKTEDFRFQKRNKAARNHQDTIRRKIISKRRLTFEKKLGELQ